MILDANFLISVEREHRRGIPGAAEAFLAQYADQRFVTTFTVIGELASGRTATAWNVWLQLWLRYPVLPWTLDISWQYGELYRQLQAQGRLIGTNDIWIAATALVYGMPVVTKNVGEFNRVEGLVVVPF